MRAHLVASRLSLRLAAGVIAVLVALVAAPASAHTVLIDGSPGPGEKAGVGTELIALEFGDAVDTTATHQVAVLDADGNPLEVSESRVGAGPTFVCTRVEALTPGVYTVRYEITAEDGHLLRNNYQFEVVEGSAPETTALGCDVSTLDAPTEEKSLDDQDQDDFPAWAVWTLAGVAVLTGALAVVAVVRSRRDDEDDSEDDATI